MPTTAVRPAKLFQLFLLLTLVFRFWLAAVFPITGDEAYFIEWGRRPDWGFYDHPPMIGWWLAALLQWGDAQWWLRLPVILQPALLALAVAAAVPTICQEADRDRAWWAALLVLLSPANVWNVFVTTDTPLVYFSVFSGLAWLKAGRSERPANWYLVSGLMLAGAVLSKYFVVLLGFAYLTDVLLVRRRRADWVGLVMVYACCLPALGLMAWWNAGHCWPNYMFNFVNRHEDAGWSWQTPLLYLATLAYLLTPPGLWGLVRGDPSAKGRRSLALLSIVPFILFALLSLVKMIGLHWLLSFVPFALLWLALTLKPRSLQRLALFFAGFAVLHMAAAIVVSRLPMETWQRLHAYDGIVLTFETKTLLEKLKPYEADYAFASDGYSNAVTLGYNARRYFLVLGEGSSHARHDDILTDFRALDGKNILVLRKSEPGPGEYQRWFRQVSRESFVVRGVRFWIIRGEGFDYPAYRDEVLVRVRDRYYALPPWLPNNGCYFCDRYFGGRGCAR